MRIVCDFSWGSWTGYFGKKYLPVYDFSGSVSVENGQLTDTQKAQIEDIVKRKTGVAADKITINVCNNQKN